MVYFYQTNNDFFLKDVSLTGGTSVTIHGNFDSNKVKQDLNAKLEDLETREIYDLVTNERIALILRNKIRPRNNKICTRRLFRLYFK
ncbi:MAG: hypothetical protein KatS3mg001_317 [Candidatus Pacearchaeota archaeon]|nr:MAG: hypothetical protein KatS3mg001_317 [Candidatus Pacearchaeota archaeon]